MSDVENPLSAALYCSPTRLHRYISLLLEQIIELFEHARYRAEDEMMKEDDPENKEDEQQMRERIMLII
jgi:hypothetical protein